ncbi:MAG: TolC family protein [Bacteriovoracia bacterium]
MAKAMTLSLGLFLLYIPCARPQENIAKGEIEVTLHLSVKKALGYAHSIQLAKEKITEADKDRSVAISQIFPTISASASISERKEAITNVNRLLFGGEPYNLYDAGISLNQPLLRGGAYLAGLGISKKEQEIRQMDLEITERDLISKVVKSFFKILLDQKKIELVENQIDFQKNLFETTKRKFKQAIGKELDMYQAQTELELLEPQLLQAQNELKSDVAEFASIVGIPEKTKIKVTGVPLVIDWQALDKKMTQLKVRRVELEKASVAAAQSVDKKDLELSKHFPQVNFFSKIGRSATRRNDLISKEDQNYWSFGVELSIPLFSGLSSVFERQKLASQTAQLELEEAKLRNELALKQVQATQELDSTIMVIKATSRAIESAKKSLAVAKKSYSKGTATYVQLVDAQRNLSRAELALEQAQFDRIIKTSEYFTVNGWPLLELVQWLNDRPT